MCSEGYASTLAAATLQRIGLRQATDLDGCLPGLEGSPPANTTGSRRCGLTRPVLRSAVADQPQQAPGALSGCCAKACSEFGHGSDRRRRRRLVVHHGLLVIAAITSVPRRAASCAGQPPGWSVSASSPRCPYTGQGPGSDR
jgi:hypothetical protein